MKNSLLSLLLLLGLFVSATVAAHADASSYSVNKSNGTVSNPPPPPPPPPAPRRPTVVMAVRG
jgi:hypothetical protein